MWELTCAPALTLLGVPAAAPAHTALLCPPQGENESALSLYETCKVRAVKAGTLEKLVEHLVPAFQGSDLSYVTIFLCTYRTFTTTQQVLDLLFKR